ncbi:MAG: glycosyltransferase, partial [Chitinivibrionales bacterium]|nr:glycosyltransferase [Chitinivibrionales bacterium]MBD3355994.1 glycosyltransferase [Chitinivibrionales bacterium]
RFCGEYPNVSLVRIEHTPAGVSPKKYAVTKAVERAHNEVVVFTDADCVVGAEWLATIDRYFAANVGLVQGITTYERPSGMNPLFFALQAVEFLSHGVVSAAAIGAGVPLNSNANNLAFRREIFERIGGYGEMGDVVSGDDDLLLQRIAQTGDWEVRYMTDPAGAVKTKPTPTLDAIFEQRKRWGSKTVHYGSKQVALLSSIFVFYVCLPAVCAQAVFDRKARKALGLMLAVKVGGEYLLMWPGTRLFGCRDLRRFLLPASLLQLPLTVAAVVLGVFGRFSWKGRRFKRRSGA